MKTILHTLAILIMASSLQAQFEDKSWYYGIAAGANLSSIGDVRTTIIRDIHPIETFNTSSNRILGYTTSFFLYYRFKDSKFAFQPELTFSSQGGEFLYDDVNELAYALKINYSYMSISPKLKAYFAGGFHIAFGPKLSINLDNSNIKYTSNMPELGPDLQIQQSLREVLKGNNNFALSVGLGYDIPLGLSFHVSYDVGITDALETLANGFFFIENTNNTTALHMTVSYAIPFFK